MSADEMFEKLEYVKVVRGYESQVIVYETYFIKIEFIKEGHYINIKANNRLNMQELQAINKKCEELGWI